MDRWVTIDADRVLYVDRGVDVILCDRDIPHELVVKLTDEQAAKLAAQLVSNPYTFNS